MGGMLAWMAVSGLISLALLMLIVVTITWLIRNMSPDRRRDSAIEELRRRYAAGHIDQKELRNRRAALHER